MKGLVIKSCLCSRNPLQSLVEEFALSVSPVSPLASTLHGSFRQGFSSSPTMGGRGNPLPHITLPGAPLLCLFPPPTTWTWGLDFRRLTYTSICWFDNSSFSEIMTAYNLTQLHYRVEGTGGWEPGRKGGGSGGGGQKAGFPGCRKREK